MEHFAGIAKHFTSEVENLKEYITTLPPKVKGANKIKVQLNLILPVLKRLPRDVLDVDLALKANAMEAPASSSSLLRRQQQEENRVKAEEEYHRQLQAIQNDRNGMVRLNVGLGGRRRTRRGKAHKRKTGTRRR